MADLVSAVRDTLGPVTVLGPLTGPAEAELLAAGARILGHHFRNAGLLAEAMTHRSAVTRTPGRRRGSGSNERLEFIGDRVLGLVIAEWLIERFADEQEGELGRRLAQLVAQPALAEIAERIGMAEMLAVAPGEARAGVKQRATVAADALEAAIGALFLDSGLDPVRRFIRGAWEGKLGAQAGPPKDAKSALQEWSLARGLGLPRYTVSGRSGPPHVPLFTVAVAVTLADGGEIQAEAAAGSKRVAERLAAEALLDRITA